MSSFISPFSSSFGDVEDLCLVGEKINVNDGYERGGFALYSNTEELIVSTNDTHCGCSGATGSKKTRSILLPSICAIAHGRDKQSMVIHDTKGTAAEFLYDDLKAQGYDVFILNFCDPGKSDHYNPLDSITSLYAKGEFQVASEKLGDIGKQVVIPGLEGGKDKYWETTTSTYHDGLYKCLARVAKYNKKYVNYANMIELHSLLSTNKRYRDGLLESLEKDGVEDVISCLNSIWNNASDTLKNLVTMINNPFKTLKSVSEIMYKSDFSVEDIVDKPTCVFINTPDESSEFNFLVSLLVKNIYGELIRISRTYKNSTLPRTVNFLIDEFGALPKIEDFSHIISTSRSRNIRWLLIYQTYSQLCSVYGYEGAKNIITNLGTIYCFQSNDYEFEDMLRRLVGKRILPYSNKEVEVIPYGTLRTLKKGEAIILALGVKNPVKVYFPDITEHPFLYKHSECLNRKRKNNIKTIDWKTIIYPELESPQERMEREFINDLKNRANTVAEINKKRRYPIVISKEIKHIEKKPFDILVKELKYGKEYEFLVSLRQILHKSETDVLYDVYDLTVKGKNLIIRCQNKKQFDEVISAFDNICNYKTFNSEGGKPESLSDFGSPTLPIGLIDEYLMDDDFDDS